MARSGERTALARLAKAAAGGRTRATHGADPPGRFRCLRSSASNSLPQILCHSAGTFGGSQPTSAVWAWMHRYVAPP